MIENAKPAATPFTVVVRYVGTNAKAWTRDFHTDGEAREYADGVASDHVWAEVRENECPE